MLDLERLRQVTRWYTVWASGFGGGVAVGADAVFAPGWIVGFALAGAGTQASLATA